MIYKVQVVCERYAGSRWQVADKVIELDRDSEAEALSYAKILAEGKFLASEGWNHHVEIIGEIES